MERLSDRAIELINELHTERLDYSSEYVPLIDALQKLAAYEDAEEQGLLLRLPCKVGDTIYVIPSKVNHDLNVLNGMPHLNRVHKQKVYSVQMWSNERYMLITCDGLWSVLSESYKETWFLDKKEAEQALKEGAK